MGGVLGGIGNGVRALVVCKSRNCFAVLVAMGERHI